MSNKYEEKRMIILDSTAIIHYFPNEEVRNENTYLILSDKLKNEIKSFQARAVLELLEAERRIIYANPSLGSIKKAKQAAVLSGDIASLSEPDLNVIALSLDYPGSTVISDDNAVQNVCSHLSIEVETYSFKIKARRVYFWRCIGCKSVFKTKSSVCPECGNKLHRYYKKSK